MLGRVGAVVVLASLAACESKPPTVPGPGVTNAQPASPAATSPTTAPAPRTAGAPSAPPVLSGDIGTAHPLVIEGVAPDGHWIVICQARADTDGDGKIAVKVGRHGDMHGDELREFLVRGDGAGAPIDAFAGADRSGRHVVVARQGKLVLIDTFADREVVLPNGVVDDGSTPVPTHGSVSFDDAGRRLLYFRGGSGADEVVVRELATGQERVVSVGRGKVWRAWLDPEGQVVWADVVVSDTDGNGKTELPSQLTSLSSRRCRGPITTYGFYGLKGDKPVRRVVREADGWSGAMTAPDALGAFGRAVVLRRADRAIVRKDGAHERTLVKARCNGRVVHASPGDERLFVGCTAGLKRLTDAVRLRAPLMRVDADGTMKPTGIDVELPDRDEWQHRHQIVYATDNRALNLETGTVGAINVGFPLAMVGDHVLFARQPVGSPGGPNVLDLATGKRTKLDVEPKGYGASAKRGDHVALELRDGTGVLFDLAKIQIVGTFAGRPLALTPSGKVLVPVRDVTQAHDEERLLTGPLRWISPTPGAPRPAGGRSQE